MFAEFMLMKKLVELVLILSVILNFGETYSCIPNKFVRLSNCSFIYPYSNLTNHQRTLSMTVPYPLDKYEDEHLSLKILQHNRTKQSLIYFNLNMIQCLNYKQFHWTSVESSSTLHGEFVRTIFSQTNIMYLSSGSIYLRNLTSIDCSTQTMYRTDVDQFFEMNLKIESTLNDFCSSEHLCYPTNIYQCDLVKYQCQCQDPLQAYLTKDKHLLCVHAVDDFRQCTIDNVRCLKWCEQGNSSDLCICPKNVSSQKISSTREIYCEGKLHGICNSLIRCPFGSECVHGFCRNLSKFFSFDLINIFIISCSILLLLLILILTICLCILRRKSQITNKSNPPTISASSDYDNIVYGLYRDNINDRLTCDRDDTMIYQPKIVFLGGDEQLTAIYA